MHAWMWWGIAALVLAAIEIFTVDLVFIMAAAGALAAGLVALAGFGVVAQFVVFIGVALVMIALVRPVALRHLRVPPEVTNVDALVGAEAVVLEQVDGRDGRVKVGGEVWSARSSDSAVVHEPGTTVHVDKIAGATVLVS